MLKVFCQWQTHFSKPILNPNPTMLMNYSTENRPALLSDISRKRKMYLFEFKKKKSGTEKVVKNPQSLTNQ